MKNVFPENISFGQFDVEPPGYETAYDVFKKVFYRELTPMDTLQFMDTVLTTLECARQHLSKRLTLINRMRVDAFVELNMPVPPWYGFQPDLQSHLRYARLVYVGFDVGSESVLYRSHTFNAAGRVQFEEDETDNIPADWLVMEDAELQTIFAANAAEEYEKFKNSEAAKNKAIKDDLERLHFIEVERRVIEQRLRDHGIFTK